MPVPTAYTEADLALYVERLLGPIAAALGWTAADGDFDEVLVDAMLDYGVSSIGAITWNATTLVAVRTLVARAAWRRAVGALAAGFDFSIDQQSFSRSQRQKMAQAALALAEQQALPYAADRPDVLITSVAHRGDPYAVPVDVLEAAGVAVEALP
jgi:hypothetical protein